MGRMMTPLELSRRTSSVVEVTTYGGPGDAFLRIVDRYVDGAAGKHVERVFFWRPNVARYYPLVRA